MAIDAVINRDLPLIQGLTLVFGALFIVVNMGVDLLVVVAQPAAASWLTGLSRTRCRTKARTTAWSAGRLPRASPKVGDRRRVHPPAVRPRARRALDRAARSAGAGHHPRRHAAGRASPAPSPAIGSAPTTSGATCCRASSTARASRCTVAFAASVLAAVVGSALGLLAGWRRGWVDARDLAAGRDLDGVSAGAAVDPAGRRRRRRASAPSSSPSRSSIGRGSAASCAPRR